MGIGRGSRSAHTPILGPPSSTRFAAHRLPLSNISQRSDDPMAVRCQRIHRAASRTREEAVFLKLTQRADKHPSIRHVEPRLQSGDVTLSVREHDQNRGFPLPRRACIPIARSHHWNRLARFRPHSLRRRKILSRPTRSSNSRPASVPKCCIWLSPGSWSRTSVARSVGSVSKVASETIRLSQGMPSA